MSELNIAIYQRFDELGITISFPQRDVHLDAPSAIPVRLITDD